MLTIQEALRELRLEEEKEKNIEKKNVDLMKELNESDKPAAQSIEDCQKWVDYDMEHYGEISERTNELVKKAGFQIVKDEYGDYEVIAGEYSESLDPELN